MIPGIEEIYLPSYVKINGAEVTLQNMGDQTITTTISVDRDVIADFSEDWILKYRGAEFIHPLRTPQGSKTSEKLNPEFPLTFYHKGIYELKRHFFVEMASVNSATPIADKYIASLSVNLGDFVGAFELVLRHYFGDYITIDLNPELEYDAEPTTIAISYSKIWDVLTGLYENYAVSWWIEPKEGGYVIKVGYPRLKLSHEFEYGFKGGLLSLERQVQSPDIRNILLGRGGTKNLPYRYFKDFDDKNPTFKGDPDWIPELQNIHFDGLRDINFRYYIQGWRDKTAGVERRYPITEHFAYDAGYAAERFDPIEYVKDDYSISKYGELWGGLSAVEDIYPSIQGVFLDGLGRIDQIVEAQQITAESESEEEAPNTLSQTVWGGVATILNPNRDEDITLLYDSRGESASSAETSNLFHVPFGFTGNLEPFVKYDAWLAPPRATQDQRTDITGVFFPKDSPRLRVFRLSDNVEFTPTAIPSGEYYYTVEQTFRTSYDRKSYAMRLTMTVERCVLTCAELGALSPHNSFCIWVKNLWETNQEAGETQADYAERVWRPILGDHEGNTPKVVFSSGMLSFNEDYEFEIFGVPQFDDSKYIVCKDEDGNDITVRSHWKITLHRNDAEYEATGELLPNPTHNAKGGDYFFLIGIDMPHQYVVWAEERLNAYKRQQLDDVSEINPTWSVSLDKVRVGRKHYDDVIPIIEQFAAGADITIFSKWLVSAPRWIEEGGESFTTTIQTVEISYGASEDNGSSLLPSVSVVLADKPQVTKSAIGLIQGEVNVLTSRINSMSAPYVIDVIKSSDDVTAPTDYNVYSSQSSNRNYIKRREDDSTDGHISFNAGLTARSSARVLDRLQFGEVFMQGTQGIGGLITDRADAELNSLSLRSWLEVPELRYNRAEVLLGDQWNAPGAGIVESVEVDLDGDGNALMTGVITLKLEQGEIGAVAVDDICKGYFHNYENPSDNAQQDVDDSRGNTRFSGFTTVYFRITEILDVGSKRRFRYMLRPISERWPQQAHPFEGMHFVAYGNFTDASRQRSAYATRSYQRYLVGVKEWEFDFHNVAMQLGDLSNLSAFGHDMRGYSAYLSNIYMTGRLSQVQIDAPAYIEAQSSNGDWFLGWGETLTATFAVKQGWNDITPTVQSWSITRDSGDAAEDAVWNASPKAQAFAGSIDICNSKDITQNDLGRNALYSASTLFTITAAGDFGLAEQSIVV